MTRPSLGAIPLVQPGRWIELGGAQPRAAWSARLTLFAALAFALTTLLTLKLADLQLVQGPRLAQQALVNRVHRIPIAADRGVIYDRHGKPLAVNVPAWSLAVTPVALPRQADQRHAVEAEAAGLAGLTPAELRDKLAADPDPYRPLTVREGLTDQQAEAVKERLPHLPGVQVRARPVRRYLEPELYAHVLGYTGPISGEEYAALKGRGYLPDERIGKGGVEAGLEETLRGRDGWQDAEVDANGQIVRVLRMQPAVPGRSVYLSIDDGLQQEAWKRLQEGLGKAGSKAGASVLVDPRDGEVLAMVSYPSYDNNLFSRGISQADFSRLLNDPGRPLYDRAVAGEYPPGSTFKMITGMAALQEGAITPSTVLGCPANSRFASWVYWNWAHYDMGPMTVSKAIPSSCDTFFYEVANRLGPETIARYAEAFGYGAAPGLEMPGMRPGVAPTPDYKLKVCPYPDGTPDCRWNVGDTVTYGIGQSYLLTTPLIQAMYVASIANRGTLLRPTLVHAETDGSGTVLARARPNVVRQVPVDPSNLDVLRAAMNQSLTGPWGTASIARSLGFKWDGGCKTGTAQFGGSGVDLPSHAWFVAFAPYAEPTIASATILENGGFGEYVAEPVAINALVYYFNHLAQVQG